MQLNERFSQTSTPKPGHQPQEFVPMELNGPPEVQAPKEVFDDTEKLSLLYVEYSWSSEDNPWRPVIIEEMKKIKNGTDLVEELKKIEKNTNLSNNISSQLELELDSIVEGPPKLTMQDFPCVTELHDCWKSSASPLEFNGETDENTTQNSGLVVSAPLVAPDSENSQVEILHNQLEGVDNDLIEGSEQDQIIVKDNINKENDMEKIQVDMAIVIQECDESGLSNPLNGNGMFLTDFSTIILHCMIPSLKVELKCDLIKLDDAYSVSYIAHTQNDGPYYPHARILLKDACLNITHISHVDPYHSHHVLYCYAYIIGYSIDDLVGVNPITCASFALCEFSFRILLVHYSLRPKMVRVDIPWDPGGCMAW